MNALELGHVNVVAYLCNQGKEKEKDAHITAKTFEGPKERRL